MKIILKDVLIVGIVKIYFKLVLNYPIWIKLNNNVKIEYGNYINKYVMLESNIVQDLQKINKLIKLQLMFLLL